MDVIATLRVSTGGTGVWPYVFMAFNKPEGVQIVFAPEVGLGDREWITEITKDEQGNLNFFLKVHNDTIDAACCPSQRAFERYHYSNGRLVKVGERTLLP